MINYSDFLSATINLKDFVDEEKVLTIFNIFDANSSGTICAENMKNTFNRLGMDVPKEEIEANFAIHDADGDGYIDYKEFKKVFEAEVLNSRVE